MIEEAMVFALGFFTAGLLALACLPVVWRRAIRLTSRRLGQLVPLSMDEIVAERDQLRAGFAVTQRRLEQKLDHVEGARSQALIEVGRRDGQILTLEDEIARERSRAAALSDDLAETTRDLFGLQAETGASAIALNDLSGLAEKRRWEVLEAEETCRSLQGVVDEGRAAIAALETRILGLEARLADLGTELAQARAELGRTEQVLARTTAERDAARQAAEAIAGKRDALQLELETRADEVAQLRQSLEQRSGSAQDAERRAAESAQALAAHQARLDAYQAERKLSEARLTAQIEVARGEARASAAAMEELRAEKAALSNALTAARQARNVSLPDPAESHGELAILRQAIKQVADDVLRITALERSPSGPGPVTSVPRLDSAMVDELSPGP